MADSLNDKLRSLKANFMADFRAESEWRDDKKEYGRFYDGDQLSADEKRGLEERGQPTVVINRIKPKCDSIFGIQQALQVDTKAYPSGNKDQEAFVVSEALRGIEDDSNFDEEETMAFEDLCIDGRGWYKAFKEFDGIEGRDRIKHASNENIVVDRFTSREDLRTGELKTSKRIHETIWLDLEDAIEMFPTHKEELELAVNRADVDRSMFTNKLSEYQPDQYAQPGDSTSLNEDLSDYEGFVDKKYQRLRFVTTWYRVPIVTRYLKHVGGTIDVTEEEPKVVEKMLEELENASSWSETRYSLNSCIFTWNTIVEEKLDIRPYDRKGKFPLFLVPAYVTRDEKKKHYGIVKQQIDAQKELNKRRSKMLHLLNVNQTWFEDGAFENETLARSETAKPDGWIKYRKEFKVDRVRHETEAQAQFQLLQESKNEVDSSGVNKELEGTAPASVSGVAFRYRQQQSLQSIRKLFVNLRAARKRVAEYMLDEILYQFPELNVTKYDLIVDEAPDTINLTTETFETLAQLAKAGVQIPVDMLIAASPLAPEKKQEFLEKRAQEQQMLAQQAQLMQQQPMAR